MLQIISELLLIVPYGIETCTGEKDVSISEAFNCTLWNWNRYQMPVPPGCQLLLIVPYGIETKNMSCYSMEELTFNCTLWNWNNDIGQSILRAYHF